MYMKLSGVALGFFLGSISGSQPLILLSMVLGWQLGGYFSEKEIEGEKIAHGSPAENGSFLNYKRVLANSIKWSKSSLVMRRLSQKKKSFYVNNFCFTDRRTKSSLTLLFKYFAKRTEKKDLRLSWDSLKKGSLIVGSMGQGKTVFMLNIMEQFAKTNRRMIVHDTKGELTEYFYREEKDFIVNHLEKRGVYWDFFIDNDRGLPVSLVLDFFHAFFLAVAGDRGDKFWSTMAALRFEEIFNSVKTDMNIKAEDKMTHFIKAIMLYFQSVKKGQDRTEQSIATTLESSFDIFIKMLYMKNNASKDGYKAFLFTDFFSKKVDENGKKIIGDSRIFLHTIEEVSRENIPFVAAFLSLLFKIQLSQTNVTEEEYILYSLDEYLTFFSLLDSDLKKSLHTKARSTGGLLLPAIQYLPKEEEDRKNLLSSVENLFLFAITDTDTQKSFSEFFGRTKITRIQTKGPKEKPDIREEEIELIDDNIVKMLKVGHHITYFPKDNGLLYVGYTRYPDSKPKVEGYIRQGRDTENNFISFKQTFTKIDRKEQKKVPPPKIFYMALDEKYIDLVLEKGIAAPEERLIQLSKTPEEAQALVTKNEKTEDTTKLIKIDAKQMDKDGFIFKINDEQEWFADVIEGRYIELA